MKKMLLILFLILITTTLIMCSAEQKQESKVEKATEETSTTTEPDTSMALCGGCGRKVEKANMIYYEIDGVYFCSELCKENYIAN